MTKSRIFIGLPLTDFERERLAAVVQHARAAMDQDKLRWVPPRNWHLTLSFLGDVEDQRLGELRAAFERVVVPDSPVCTAIEQLGGFPQRRPVVVAAVLSAPEPLVRLAAALRDALLAAGFAPDPRPFRPHLTLARFRRRRAAACPTLRPKGSVTFSRLAILASLPAETGVRYQPLAERSMAGSVGDEDD